MLSIAGTDEGIEYGRSYLHRAADLWSLVDPRRGEAINAFLREEGQPRDDDPDIDVYPVARLPHLLGLLDGLDDALRAEVTDEHFRVDAETAARLKAQNELLVESFDDESGAIHTLENRVSEVHQATWLVKKAIEMGRDLEND
jgi:hypothetical protein